MATVAPYTESRGYQRDEEHVMTYSPDHVVAQMLYRQQQLRREADAYRRNRPARSTRSTRDHHVRATAGQAVASLYGRIRRSLDSLTEWPRPV